MIQIVDRTMTQTTILTMILTMTLTAIATNQILFLESSGSFDYPLTSTIWIAVWTATMIATTTLTMKTILVLTLPILTSMLIVADTVIVIATITTKNEVLFLELIGSFMTPV